MITRCCVPRPSSLHSRRRPLAAAAAAPHSLDVSHPSQVTFDQLPPAALRTLLAEVLGEVDKAQRGDPAEHPDAAAARTVAFLQVLKFGVPQDV